MIIWCALRMVLHMQSAKCTAVLHSRPQGGFPGTWPTTCLVTDYAKARGSLGGHKREDWGRWHAKKVTLRQCIEMRLVLKHRHTETCWHGGKVTPPRQCNKTGTQCNDPCAPTRTLAGCYPVPKYKSFFSTIAKQKKLTSPFLFSVSPGWPAGKWHPKWC